MKKIDAFIHQYSISKTLRFSLLPVGKTEENFHAKWLLETDRKRAEEYRKVKGYIDRYHKYYMESVLSTLVLKGVNEYAALYYRTDKTDADYKAMEKSEAAMRKQIAKALTGTDAYKAMFGKDMVETVLPTFLDSEEERAVVEMFRGFTTYFNGFFENRKNMYSDEPQVTAVAHRCVHDNLPKLLDNAAAFVKVKAALPAETMDELNATYEGLYGVSVEEVFSVDYAPFVLAQSGIDRYNGILGGYACEDHTKIKGLNEYINLYNQQVAGKDRSKRLPLMKPLYKQILSDREKVSFLPEQFSSDNEAVASVAAFYNEVACAALDGLQELFAELETFDPQGIYVSSGAALTDLSHAAFGSWNALSNAWEEEYRAQHPLKGKTDPEKYEEKMREAYKKIPSFSLARLRELADADAASLPMYYKEAVNVRVEAVRSTYTAAEALLTANYEQTHTKKLCQNQAAIEQLKLLLDAVKELERLIKPLGGNGKEEVKDFVFYGRFAPLYEALSTVDRLYDKVRNYVTQKPYSKNKIKLNFDNPTFMNGWALSKEVASSTQLFRREGRYYLAIMDKEGRSSIPKSYPRPLAEDDVIEKMIYQQMASPVKDIPNLMVIDGKTVRKTGRKETAGEHAGENLVLENLKNKYLPQEINQIRKKRSFSSTSEWFSKEDLVKYIDFYAERIKEYCSDYTFHFKEAHEYESYADFLKDVDGQTYQIRFEEVSYKAILDLVDSGQLYLFQIYNKDFSPYTKGRPNLHTLYFKMLFDGRNLADVVFQLNGGAEMFYREAGIRDEERVIHPANQAINNKNPDNPRKQSTFTYDLIKDRRFTKRQFALHLPITLNFKASGRTYLNEQVRAALKYSDDNYVIGIDRGERHLLYICVINGNGDIVEQRSLNEIIGDNGYKVDYHALLDRKEAERDAARKSWDTIENIKELKEGYLSMVVHEICRLMLKYDAIVAMEDLNFGFKRGRFKVEKQVYQKFENMLIQKLNFLADKQADPTENGGLLRAYQLTNKVEGVHRGRQNGFLFYVPAWLTSKIDPTTGFADLLKPRYTSMADAKTFIAALDAIRYNEAQEWFEFDVDYAKFPRCHMDYRKRWTVCSYADRIETFRNPQKNHEWDNRTVLLTDEWQQLFSEYGVAVSADMQEAILQVKDAEFYRRFMKLMGLTLQMRNSKTGDREVDYLISPVQNADGVFYDSRESVESLPANADANGAYNIARKARWMIEVLKNTADDELMKADTKISNAAWLEYAQR